MPYFDRTYVGVYMFKNVNAAAEWIIKWEKVGMLEELYLFKLSYQNKVDHLLI